MTVGFRFALFAGGSWTSGSCSSVERLPDAGELDELEESACAELASAVTELEPALKPMALTFRRLTAGLELAAVLMASVLRRGARAETGPLTQSSALFVKDRIWNVGSDAGRSSRPASGSWNEARLYSARLGSSKPGALAGASLTAGCACSES